MKGRYQRDEEDVDDTKSAKFTKMQKNMKRLGGGGLSLETFANLKSANGRYNPALIKKQKEFYKNAKYVSKFKKTLKQQNPENDASSSRQRVFEGNKEGGDRREVEVDEQKRRSKSKVSLEEVYRKKHEELEKARTEREAMIQAKKEAREKAEARRKEAKGKMLKKTRHGQPLMKYRIEHLLESIKNSSENH
ncbi:PREDICTED: rRNA-processing protein FYV7 [Tarenaya hassleriana]|uniref:rRNA-processing protein FYV7 n=1 Tax=Tarenaya hassleriana TaxID=28532 RepID=UPI00053C8BA0|nr:PREDICTED: rRNA-processing protein FYV7 [Tarenaya hassleriana]